MPNDLQLHADYGSLVQSDARGIEARQVTTQNSTVLELAHVLSYIEKPVVKIPPNHCIA